MLDSSELQPNPAPAAPAGGPGPVFASEPDEEQPEGERWWSRFLRSRGHHDADLEPSADNQNGTNGHIATDQVVLSQAELNQRIAREAQSLHDRDVARRNREQQIADRRRVRDEDPWAYAEQDRQAEESEQLRQQQNAQLMQLLGHVGRQHDAATLDPLISVLPDKERERILGLPNAGQGLEGRKLIASEALKTYGSLEYQRGYRDAQAKLKRDPVFRKSVLHELRGNYDEPELYPGDSSPAAPEDNVSNRLRSAFFNRG